jgi:hypothetical protein
LKGEFLRPSQVDAHVGPALEAVILRCLRSAPGERFPDGHAVGAALGEVARDVHALLGAADSGTVLRRFFDEGAAKFSATVSPRVADQAHEQAQRSFRRHEKTRALAEINRAFAYVPDHQGAQALLAAISRRRRLGRVASTGLALAAVIAAGAGAQHWRAVRRAAGAAVAAPVVASRSAAAVGGGPPAVQPVSPTPTPTPTPTAEKMTPIAVGPAPAPPAVSVSAASKHRQTARPHVEASAAPGGAKEKARPGAAAGSATRATAAASPTTPPAPTPTPTPAPPPTAGAAHSDDVAATKEAAHATAPAVPASPPTPAAVAARPTPTASLALRASQGFCSPSLDDRPASIHPSYDHLAPGVHHLFCTLPGGAKVFVANYDLRPGTRPNLVIVPGADGRPQLSLPD